jgi:hypothetical protein
MESTESAVRPVLVENCYRCHGPKKQQGGLRLDSRRAILAGGDSGPAVVPGDPAKSLLVQAVRQSGERKMPPKGKLKAEAVEALAAWVQMGAPWPGHEAAGNRQGDHFRETLRMHWALQPLGQPVVPTNKDEGWTATPIDRFVLAGLEAKGLRPSPAADRRTLIRRATFDLIGLPPAPQDVEAFVNDPSPDAFARVVDRLLASPHYGERWARHWLDVARYADTRGYEIFNLHQYATSAGYRDYVIRAFNEDLPYDQFILHQLAADQLPLGADKHRRGLPRALPQRV